MIPARVHPSSSGTLHVVGDGTGPPLALAHGAGGGVVLNFTGLIQALRSERTMVGVDYPGSGGTPRTTEPLTLEHLADALVEAMVRRGHETFPVLGLSLGSAVALTAAARHPDRITGLVLTVGLARADAQVAGFVRVWRRLAELEEWEALASLLVTASSPGALAAMTPPERELAVAQTRQHHPPGGADQAALAAAVDVEHLLAEVAVPTLVVVAGQDRIILPSTTRALAAGIEGSEIVEYPEAGHIFTPEETERWVADVAGFLRRHGL